MIEPPTPIFSPIPEVENGAYRCPSLPMRGVPGGVRITYESTHLRKGVHALKTILEALAEMRAGVRPLPVVVDVGGIPPGRGGGEGATRGVDGTGMPQTRHQSFPEHHPRSLRMAGLRRDWGKE